MQGGFKSDNERTSNYFLVTLGIASLEFFELLEKENLSFGQVDRSALI